MSELNLLVQNQKTVPDIAVVPKMSPDLQHDVLWETDVPVTTIEVLSPKQDLDTLLEKARLFLSAGVQSCWIVLPAVSTIYVFTGPATYRAFANDGIVHDEMLGVEIPLADIFS